MNVVGGKTTKDSADDVATKAPCYGTENGQVGCLMIETKWAQDEIPIERSSA